METKTDRPDAPETPEKPEKEAPHPDPTQVRYLHPDMCRIHLGSHGALHVTVVGERIYGGVYAANAFPVAHTDRFISLVHAVKDGEDIEIGLIRDLGEFPADQVKLVREALARRYFIHIILRIPKIGWKYGMVQMQVETDKGHIDFFMQWKTDRAVDYGRKGKVLIDVNENRYLIPDLDALTPKEKEDFTRIIYW
jgi:hypothetical protein